MGRSLVVLVIAVCVAGCGNQKTANPQTPPDATTALDRAEHAEVESEGKTNVVPTTQMTRKEALSVAEAKAKSEGYQIDKYNMTGCHYEFTDKDQTWTVFYELKPPTPPGGHFLVSINDQTKEARLVHGE